MAALILGARARPLAGELAELLNSGDECPLYTYALARMGPDGIPALTQALTNRETFIQNDALLALECADANLDSAVPALLNVLTNGGGFPSIQNIFLKARGASGAIIPVAEAAAHHTNWVIRENAEATLQVLRATDSGAGQKQGRLRLEKYGNGELAF